MAELSKGGTSWSRYKCVSRQVPRQIGTPCAQDPTSSGTKRRYHLFLVRRSLSSIMTLGLWMQYGSRTWISRKLGRERPTSGNTYSTSLAKSSRGYMSLTARETCRLLVKTMIRSIYDNEKGIRKLTVNCNSPEQASFFTPLSNSPSLTTIASCDRHNSF